MLPTIVVTVLFVAIAAVTLNGYVQEPHRDHAVASILATATESAASAGIGASPETVSSASGASIEADKDFICEETWGIFPCSSHAIGSIVLLCPHPATPFPTHPRSRTIASASLSPSLQVHVRSLHVGGL